MGLVLIVAFAIFALAALAQYFLAATGLPGGTEGLVGVLVICSLFLCAGGFIFTSAAASPQFLRVDAQGLTFLYAGGRADSVLWDKPSLRIHIERTTGFVRHGQARPALAVVIGGRPSRRFLTPQACDALVRQAAAAGLRVLEEPSSFRGFTKVVITSR